MSPLTAKSTLKQGMRHIADGSKTSWRTDTYRTADNKQRFTDRSGYRFSHRRHEKSTMKTVDSVFSTQRDYADALKEYHYDFA